jgi:hypothetical protein
MTWRAPTETDILNAGCSGAELTAFRGAALASGQADPLAGQIAIVVNFMRGYIARCPNVDMTTKDDGTIPECGILTFCDIIVPIIQGRPAGALIDPNGIRLDARGNAMKWLTDAARCLVAVDEVPPPDAPGAPIPKPLYNTPRRRAAFP